MHLNVKIVYFVVKNVHFIEIHVFHRKNTIKPSKKRCCFFFKMEVIVVEP